MPNDWELDHVAIVVRDINAAIKYYHRMGIDLITSPETQVIEVSGTEVDCKVCFVQNNAIRIKFVQPLNNTGLFYEYLNKHGEGVSHIECVVSDMQAEKTRLTSMGVPVIATTKREDGSDLEIYFDTRKFGNVIFVLFNEPVPFSVFKPAEGKWKLRHIGFVVRDIHKFTEYYESLGFKIYAKPKLRSPSQDILDYWTINGKIPLAPLRSWECRMHNAPGTFFVDGRQPVEGETSHQEFLNIHGEGMEHIHFFVNDLPDQLVHMVTSGFPATSTHKKLNGKLRDTFYDTTEIGSVRIGLWNDTVSINVPD